jgi:hypothetical protein
MVKISPIYELEAQAAGREFFQPGYVFQRQGQPGCWLGAGAKLLSLKQPMEKAAFLHLLAGRTPDGGHSLLGGGVQPKCVQGWRVILSASPSLSVLWAVSPLETRRRIEAVHGEAVGITLRILENAVSGRDWDPQRKPDPREGGLMAAFTCGAERDLSPHLHTTVVLFNLHFSPGARITTFDHVELMSRQSEILAMANSAHRVLLEQRMGRFKVAPGMEFRLLDVPPDWGQLLDYNPAADRPGVPATKGSEPLAHSLQGKEVFDHWRHQAQQHGWGAREASVVALDAVLRKGVADVKHKCQEVFQRGADRLQHARDSLLGLAKGRETPSKPQEPTKSQSQDHTRSR